MNMFLSVLLYMKHHFWIKRLKTVIGGVPAVIC